MRALASLLFALVLFASGLAASAARADLTPMTGAAVAPNIAEITISERGVTVQLEIFVGDVGPFRALLPDSWIPEDAGPRDSAEERLAEFGRSGLSIRDGTGAPLPLSLALIEPRMRVDRAPPNAGKIDPITGRRFPEPPDDPRVIFAELHYAFGDQRPEQLEIVPPLDAEGQPFLSIGMVVFDRDVPVTDFRYLSDSARMTLDWNDPWYTRFENPNLRRHHRNPVMTFLYAEPYEIRHEAVMRVREAAALAGVPLDGPYLSEAERAALSEALPDLVNVRSPMTVDGSPVRPDFDRLAFLRVGPSGLVYLQDGERVRTDAALVGLIYAVPTDRFAKEASVEWTLFSPEAQQIPAQTIDAAGPFLAELTPDDPVLVWTNYFKRPPYPEVSAILVEGGSDQRGLMTALGLLGAVFAVAGLLSLVAPHRLSRRLGLAAAILAVVCAGAVPVMQRMQTRATLQMDADQLRALSTNLLNNIYRAFDFRLEDQVYDRLAMTLSGDVLEQVYLDQRAALRVERAGGAQARVDALEVLRVEQVPSDNPGVLRLAVEWQVSGTVGHWGHNHRRNNAYVAELTILPQDGVWKIGAFDLQSLERRL